MQQENFGNTILCPNCWTVRGALSQSILDNWAVSHRLWDAMFKGWVDSRARLQVIDVQTQMQSFNFFLGIQLGVLVLRHRDNSSSTLRYTTSTCHFVKLSKLQKYVFHDYKAWERKIISVCFLKKLERQNEN